MHDRYLPTYLMRAWKRGETRGRAGCGRQYAASRRRAVRHLARRCGRDLHNGLRGSQRRRAGRGGGVRGAELHHRRQYGLPCSHTMRVELIGHFKTCMTEIYLHIDARMADYSHC